MEKREERKITIFPHYEEVFSCLSPQVRNIGLELSVPMSSFWIIDYITVILSLSSSPGGKEVVNPFIASWVILQTLMLIAASHTAIYSAQSSYSCCMHSVLFVPLLLSERGKVC